MRSAHHPVSVSSSSGGGLKDVPPRFELKKISEGDLEPHTYLATLLSKTNIRELVLEVKGEEDVNRAVVVLEVNTTFEDAIKILNKNHLLSAPVRENDTFIGFVDVVDLVTAVLEFYCEGGLHKEGTSIPMEEWVKYSQDIATLTHRGIRLGSKPLKDIINLSNRDPFVPVYEKGTLYQLVEVFSRGLHRVPVMDDRGIITRIVSQSDVVNWFARKLATRRELLPLCSLKVQEMTFGIEEGDRKMWGIGNVICMSSSAQAIHAFNLLVSQRVSAVAIVDKEEKLVASISASDIRSLDPQHFPYLLKPVMEYFSFKSREYSIYFSVELEAGAPIAPRSHLPTWQRPPSAPLVCTLATTIEAAIFKIAFFRVHRLWVVDENFKPIGVLTLTDIMKWLVSHLPVGDSIPRT